MVGVSVGVFVGVEVGVLVGVSVGVLVGVDVGVLVGVNVGVLVGVNVGVLVGTAGRQVAHSTIEWGSPAAPSPVMVKNTHCGVVADAGALTLTLKVQDRPGR